MAGSTTISSPVYYHPSERHGGFATFEISWTADTEGAVPSATMTAAQLSDVIGMQIVRAEIYPDADTAPTNNYGVTFKNADGLDAFGGQLASLSATVAQQRLPKVDDLGTIYGSWKIVSALTFALTGNSVNGAKGKLRFICER